MKEATVKYFPAACPAGHGAFLVPEGTARELPTAGTCPRCGLTGRPIPGPCYTALTRERFELLVDFVYRAGIKREDAARTAHALEELMPQPVGTDVRRLFQGCAGLEELQVLIPPKPTEVIGFAALTIHLLFDYAARAPAACLDD